MRKENKVTLLTWVSFNLKQGLRGCSHFLDVLRQLHDLNVVLNSDDLGRDSGLATFFAYALAFIVEKPVRVSDPSHSS